MRFLFISDLHNVTFGRKNEVLIRKMKELRPHAVLVGGDLIVAKPGYSMDPAMELIREMGARFPVYYALGKIMSIGCGFILRHTGICMTDTKG